ncbi:MAG: hypothetical protein RL338_135 [Chloroflexota bacterium]|jgi:hypothetical protein
MKKLAVSIMLVGALLASTFGTALAVGGPWEAGNSGHFKNNTPPCNGGNPHCPPFGR